MIVLYKRSVSNSKEKTYQSHNADDGAYGKFLYPAVTPFKKYDKKSGKEHSAHKSE